MASGLRIGQYSDHESLVLSRAPPVPAVTNLPLRCQLPLDLNIRRSRALWLRYLILDLARSGEICSDAFGVSPE